MVINWPLVGKVAGFVMNSQKLVQVVCVIPTLPMDSVICEYYEYGVYLMKRFSYATLIVYFLSPSY